jgi:hypothetical protein
MAKYCEEILCLLPDTVLNGKPFGKIPYENSCHVDALKVRLLSPESKGVEVRDDRNPAIGKGAQLAKRLSWLPPGWSSGKHAFYSLFIRRMKTYLAPCGARCLLPVNLGGLGLCPDSTLTDWVEVLGTLTQNELKAVAVVLKVIAATPGVQAECANLIGGYSRSRFARGVRTVPLEEDWIEFGLMARQLDENIRDPAPLEDHLVGFTSGHKSDCPNRDLPVSDMRSLLCQCRREDEERHAAFMQEMVTRILALPEDEQKLAFGGQPVDTATTAFDRHFGEGAWEPFGPDAHPSDLRFVDKLELLRKHGIQTGRQLQGELSRAHTFRQLLLREKPEDWRTVPFAYRQKILDKRLGPIVGALELTGDHISAIENILQRDGASDRLRLNIEPLVARPEHLDENVQRLLIVADTIGADILQYAGDEVRDLLECYYAQGGTPAGVSRWLCGLNDNRPTLRIPVKAGVLRK